MPLDLKAAAADWLQTRKKGFSHDRRLSVGASEIGMCAQRIWREKKLGPEKYDKSYKPADGAAFRGDVLEDSYTVEIVRHAIKTQLPKEADLIWAGPGEQHTLQAPEWRLSATPDGLLINAPRDALAHYGVSDLLGTSAVIEMKSFDPRIDAESLPKQTHIDQVNVQLGLLRKEGTIVPMWGLLVYVNASFPDDLRAFPIPFNKIKFENQIRRALTIMSTTDVNQLRPEGKIAGEHECRYCPFAEQCLGYVPRVPWEVKQFDRLGPGDQLAIMSRIGTLDNVRRQIKALEMKEADAAADVKEALTKAGTKRVGGALKDGRRWTASWDKMAGRQTLDKEKLAAFLDQHGFTLDEFMARGAEGERLLVKVQDKRVFLKDLEDEKKMAEMNWADKMLAKRELQVEEKAE